MSIAINFLKSARKAVMYKIKKRNTLKINVLRFNLWSHQDLNLGPPDYESGATNQLSYRTKVALNNPVL